jgi:medium-chain acyl-[acyl-carrier-protein] hydrolase
MMSASPWFVCFERLRAPTVRLFCLPYAGGGAASYRSWRTTLPSGVEVWAVRPPGRESRFRERPFHRLAPLVEALERELDPLLDLPFGIFGHSLGALTGFELARGLERRDHGPRHLWVAAHSAPHLRPTASPVHLAPDDVILGRLRRYGGTPAGFYENDDLVSALLPNLRADMAVSETYRYTDTTPLRCGVTAFGGVDDPLVTGVAIDEWEQATSGPFRAHVFHGGHFFWLADPAPMLHEIGADLLDSFPELR